MSDDSRFSKEFKAAQKRAAKRKAALDKALQKQVDTPSTDSKVIPDSKPEDLASKKSFIKKSKNEGKIAPVSLPKESSFSAKFLLFLNLRASLFLPIFSLLGVLLVVWGVLITTPLISGEWDINGVGLILISFLFFYLSSLVIRSAGGFSKTLSLLMCGLVIIFAPVGVFSQVVVDGQAQLIGSQLDRAQRINDDILNDMYILENNQKLLELPLEQARGLAPSYQEAISTGLSIAAKWNPATASNLPSPGYLPVFRKVNTAADLQASALGLYIANMSEYDNARQEQIISSRSEIYSLLSGQQGAATLLSETATTLGLTLNLQRGN